MRNVLLRLAFYFFRLLRPRVNSSPATFLILQYRIPLGCCVHGTPIYAALKAANPDCTLVVATYGLGYEVLSHDPNIDHLINSPNPGKSLFDLHHSARHLRQQLSALNLRPTQILQDASNRRGTLALFAMLLRLAPTAGFADIPQLYDKHNTYDPNLSLIDNNLRLVGPKASHVEPAVYFTTNDLAAARSLLFRTCGIEHPIVAIAVQGSGAQPNSWHDSRFAGLVRQIESAGHRTIFLGTDAETSAIDRIRERANSRGYSLAGLTSIPQLTALLCLCDMLISVDTGALHVGRAAQLPILALAPTWQPAIEWLPIAVPNATVLRGPDKVLASADIPADYRLDEISLPLALIAFGGLERRFPFSIQAREQRVTRLLSNTRS